jgi:hypothetical protein
MHFPECQNFLGPIVPNGESVLHSLLITKLALLILCIQELRSLGLTTSSTRFEECSTLEPSSIGLTLTTASLLQNVHAQYYLWVNPMGMGFWRTHTHTCALCTSLDLIHLNNS